jgi:hypothetical protein
MINRRGPRLPGPLSRQLTSAISALATRQLANHPTELNSNPQLVAATIIAPVTCARSSSAMTYGGIA